MNKVEFIGNAGKNPEVKEFNDGKIVNLTLATTERGYTRQNGTQVPDHTDWHSLVFRGSLAEVVEKYVHKGDKLYVAGKLRYREYDKNGVKNYVTEIVVSDLELLSPKKDGAPANAPAPQTQAPQPKSDDDMPF